MLTLCRLLKINCSSAVVNVYISKVVLYIPRKLKKLANLHFSRFDKYKTQEKERPALIKALCWYGFVKIFLPNTSKLPLSGINTVTHEIVLNVSCTICSCKQYAFLPVSLKHYWDAVCQLDLGSTTWDFT